MFQRLLPLCIMLVRDYDITRTGLLDPEIISALAERGVPQHSDSFSVIETTFDHYAQESGDGEEDLRSCLQAQIKEHEKTKAEMIAHFTRMKNFPSALVAMESAPPDRHFATYYAIRDLYLSVDTALLEEAQKEWKSYEQSAPINKGVELVERALGTLNKVLDFERSPALDEVYLESHFDAERAVKRARHELELIRVAHELQAARASVDEGVLGVISELTDFTTPFTVRSIKPTASDELLLTDLRDMPLAELAEHLGEFVKRLHRDQIQDLLLEAYRLAR